MTNHQPEPPAHLAEAKRAERRIRLWFGIVVWVLIAALDVFIIVRDSSRPGPMPSSIWIGVALLVVFGALLVRFQLRSPK